VSGVITRSIGRLVNDSSPVRVLSNDWAARIPVSKRIVVPELPTFRMFDGGVKPREPRPSMLMVVSLFLRVPALEVFMVTPRFLRHESVA